MLEHLYGLQVEESECALVHRVTCLVPLAISCHDACALQAGSYCFDFLKGSAA